MNVDQARHDHEALPVQYLRPVCLKIVSDGHDGSAEGDVDVAPIDVSTLFAIPGDDAMGTANDFCNSV